jgi:hypothetical protein
MSLAAAQEDLVPERFVSVRDRPRPEYDALGVRLGGFRLYPRLTIGASHDDNIFATNTDVIDDRIAAVGGNVRLSSQGGRVPMSVYASANSRSYSDNPLEDHVNWEGGGSIDYTFAPRTAVSVSGNHTLDHESRGEPSFPSEAIELPSVETSGAVVGITHQFASGQLSFTADYRSTDFDDTKLAEGATLDQDFRDRDTRILQIQSGIIVGETTTVFVRAVHEERDYKLDAEAVGVDRDATSDALFGGAAFDISNLMRGEVAIGVFDLDNHDPDQSDRRSVAVSSNVDLYVTQLLTATMDVQRTSAAADIVGSASAIGTSVSLGLDYELRRNLILSATFARSRREFTGVVDRTDTSKRAGINAQWLLNRHVSVGFNYAHIERRRPIAADGRNFTERIVGATMSFAL